MTSHKLNDHNYLQVPKILNQAPFTKDQLDTLQQLLNKSPQPTLVYDLGGVTQQGDYNQTLHVAKSSFAPWIVDSGASDHITGDKSLFSQFYPSRSHHTVRIANDSHAKVVGKGTIQLSEILTLYSVLFVSSLDCNLLSIRTLNKDLNCETKFLVNSSVFQDLESERMFGNAELCAGLYILKVDKSPIGHDLRTWC